MSSGSHWVLIEDPQNNTQAKVLKLLNFKGVKALTASLNHFLEKGALGEILDFVKKDRRASSILSSKCYLEPRKTAVFYFLENLFASALLTTKKKAFLITERLLVYVVIATIVGARLGHILFYENLQDFLKNPINIFKIREGGLASHGAVVAILLALFLFTFYSRRFSPKIRFLNLLDFSCISAGFIAFCIRIGNFINQEILGKITSVPWAVVFLNPLDRSLPLPRHPVQLYEALFYLAIFSFIFYLSFKPSFLLKRGRLSGLFFILLFSGRFFLEFFKERQSFLIKDFSFLLMGQYLSIPFILLGIVLFFGEKFLPRKS